MVINHLLNGMIRQVPATKGTGQFTIFNSCNTAEAIAAPSKVAVPRLKTKPVGLQAAQGSDECSYLFWGEKFVKKAGVH